MAYPKTYQEAKEIGFKHYYTGRPCKRGHINLRYASSKECVTCRVVKNQDENHIAYLKQYKEQHKEIHNADARKRYHNNIAKERERSKNKWLYNKEKIMQTNKNWVENNPDKYKTMYRARNAKRRLVVKQQMPKWADAVKIKEIYKNKPDGCHVDHIIPLRGKLVSGLHVENNLQYLTASENSRKKNHYYGV